MFYWFCLSFFSLLIFVLWALLPEIKTCLYVCLCMYVYKTVLLCLLMREAEWPFKIIVMVINLIVLICFFNFVILSRAMSLPLNKEWMNEMNEIDQPFPRTLWHFCFCELHAMFTSVTKLKICDRATTKTNDERQKQSTTSPIISWKLVGKISWPSIVKLAYIRYTLQSIVLAYWCKPGSLKVGRLHKPQFM